MPAIGVLLGLSCVWGASFLFIKVVVEETGPFELVLGRLFFGLLAVLAFVVYRRAPVRATPRVLALTALMALVSNVIPFGLIAWGEKHIDSGVASVLNSTVPIFTSLFAAALLAEERFTAARAYGLALGLLGVAVLSGEDILHITDSSVLGELAVVAAAACYGIGAIIARNLLRTHDPVGLSVLQLGFGVLWSLPLIVVFSGTPDYSLSLKATASLVTLGIMGTGFGYIAWLWLIENIGSVRASLVTYVVPVIALLLGWLVLNESVGPQTIAGAALIIVGVASVLRGQVPARAGAAAAPEAVALE